MARGTLLLTRPMIISTNLFAGFPIGPFLGFIVVNCKEKGDPDDLILFVEHPIPGWARNFDYVEFIHTPFHTARITRRGTPGCDNPFFEVMPAKKPTVKKKPTKAKAKKKGKTSRTK
jgi:hypothetical protein